MNDEQNSPDSLRTIYSTLGSLHSAIVSTRFAIAGLYIAALAFLVSSLTSDSDVISIPNYCIALLGIGLSIALWILKVRNHCLLVNLEKQGREIESILKITSKYGLFQLMESQPDGPQIPFLKIQFPYKNEGCPKEVVKYIFTHSFGLSLVYLLGTIFWMTILLHVK